MNLTDFKYIIEIDKDVYKRQEEGFEKMDTVNAKLSFEKKAQLTETALGILDIYAPQKQSMLSGLAGKELVSQDERCV